MKQNSTYRLGPFTFRTKSRTWSFRPPGFPCLTVADATCSVSIAGQCRTLGEASEAEYSTSNAKGRPSLATTFRFADPAMTLRIEFAYDAGTQSLHVSGHLHNDSGHVLILDAIDLLHLDSARGGVMSLGYRPERVTRFKMATWDTCARLLSDGEGPQWSNYIGHLYNPMDGIVFYAGFETVHRTLAGVEVLVEKKPMCVQRLRAWCAYLHHELQPDATIDSEELRVQLGRDPYRALEGWADALQRRYRPRLNPKTTVGWIGWAWVDALSPREERAEQIVRGNAEAIRRRLPGFDIDYIWMSQVNLKDMVPGNWLEFNREHFPHGFEATLKHLLRLRFKPGLWIAPFWLFGNAKPLEENRDNLVRRKDGTTLMSPTSWEFIQSESKEPDQFELYHLDGSHPGTEKFLTRVFRAYHKLGIRYYMADFLGCACDRSNHDKSMTWLQADRQLMETVRRAAGPDTHLLTAVGSTPAYIGCTDAARVNTDFGEGRPLFPPFRCLFNATYVVHDPYYGNIRLFLQNAASTYFTHRKLYINDYNLLTLDKPVPRNIAEIAATVFGLSGSPIMIGDDLRHMHDERLAMLKKVLPRTAETARPLDLFRRPQPDDYARILTLPVTTDWDKYLLVGLVNLDPVTWRTELVSAELGLKAKAEYTVYDFWQEEYCGRFRDRLTVEVPPLTVRLLRISQARPHPWLLSTDMHVQQGKVEITKLAWDPKRSILSGSATRPKGETGNIFFLMPGDLQLVNHEGHYLMKDGQDGSVIIRRQINFRRSVEPFSLQFRPLDKEARPISYFVQQPKKKKQTKGRR